MSASPLQQGLPVDQSWVQVGGIDTLGRPDLPEEAPPTSLLISELAYFEECEVRSSHDVKKMKIVTEPDKDRVVYFKKCDSSYPSILAQIEAASSASMRLSRGEHSAYVRTVVDDKGKVVGTASYEIPTFTSFSGESISAGVMLRLGVMDELVARYVRMEGDLHGDQIGVAKNLGVVGLDFDEQWYGEITAEIKGPRVIYNGVTAPLPKDLFPITDRDINQFPDIVDAQPCHWPTKLPTNWAVWKRFLNRDEFLKLGSDPMYDSAKYFAFLREILIDSEEHIQVMAPHFARNDEGKEMIGKMRKCISNRWEVLTEVLVQNEGFRKYLLRNKTAIREIADHFKLYNQRIAIEGVQLDLQKLDLRFQHIVRRCMVKDLTVILFDLGCKLKGNKSDWDAFKLSYQLLIDISINFKTCDCSFPDAFFTLECELSNLALDHRERMSEWGVYTKNITQLLDNYRGLVTKKLELPVMSIRIDRPRRDSLSLEDGSLDLEKCMARALLGMLEDPSKLKLVLEAVGETYTDYAPSRYSLLSFTRVRGDDISGLLRALEAHPDQMAVLISNFLKTGEWNSSGHLLGASANVTLICRLAEKLLADFKSQVTLQQLRKHDMVELCFALDRKEWDIEKSARNIKTLFSDAIGK